MLAACGTSQPRQQGLLRQLERRVKGGCQHILHAVAGHHLQLIPHLGRHLGLHRSAQRPASGRKRFSKDAGATCCLGCNACAP